MMMMLLTAGLLLSSCGNKKTDTEKAPVRVKTEVVNGQSSARSKDACYQRDARMVNGQSFVGIVEEREGTAVSFTSMGVVKRVLVTEGQNVGRGQLIAEMDDTQARNLLSGAEAAMAQANDALERYKMLHDNGSLPEVQWVEIQSKVAQAKSQFEIAKKNLADCRLTAPVSGIVGSRMIKAGETALPSQAVVTILDISSVKVKVSIPEAEIGNISATTPTMIKVDAADKEVTGGKIEKGVQADALTHTYDIKVNVPNADRKLLPGMVANVSLAPVPSPKGEGSSYTLPITSVQKKADGSLFVWTISKDSTAHRTPVVIGKTYGNRVVINSGVSADDCVVTEGYQKLSEGSRVIY